MSTPATLPTITESERSTSPVWRTIAAQFFRYCVVGGLAFAVDYGILLFTHYVLGIHYRVAAGLGFSIGLIVNYIISVCWVFDSRAVKNRTVEFLVYAGVGVLGLFVNDLVIHTCTQSFGWTPGLSKIPAAALVLVMNFGLRKSLLFSKS